MRLFGRRVINRDNIENFIKEKKCVLPYYIKEIEADVFENCDDLERIETQSERVCKEVYNNLKSIGKNENIKLYCNDKRFYNMNNDGYLLITEEQIEEPFMYEECVEDLIAPNLVSLGKDSLKNCIKLKKIGITSIQQVDEGAFDRCKKLAEITLNSGGKICELIYKVLPENIRDNVRIYDGTNIWNEYIISNAKTIKGYKFNKCKDLQRVELSAVEVLEECSFCECEQLSEVKLPIANNTIIKACAFKGCSKLKNINLEKVTNIGSRAFIGCESLESIDLSSAKEVGGGAFENCGSLHIVDLSSVEKLGEGAFSGCEGIEEVTLGDNLNEIFMQTFGNCNNLKEINLGKIETIHSQAFSGCKKLETIDLSNVKEICEDAFAQCSELKEISLNSIEKVPINNPFWGCKNIELVKTTKEKEKMVRNMLQDNNIKIQFDD